MLLRRTKFLGFSATYPDLVQIDHTPVDLIIVDEVTRRPIGRPYLTASIDNFSRCITGFCLTLEAPSAVSVGLCLVHSVIDKTAYLARLGVNGEWPIWGKPLVMYVDNAAAFHSEALRRGYAQHGIELRYRPLGEPQYGGIMDASHWYIDATYPHITRHNFLKHSRAW
ncbi:MAG: DDE-type integrase/transposase/recombinase [Legionellaceae bacterium]|nr:DDE-type integrase/transposase/recombinase [Legionellaceae bacterium]MBP9775087.1 DDE-type integrase/transposase/recombinase [Legionellaceae bacterium]